MDGNTSLGDFSTPSIPQFGSGGTFGSGPAGSFTFSGSPSGTDTSTGSGMSGGQMAGLVAGGIGLAGMSGLFGGGRGSSVNLDPYGLGSGAAQEAQTLWKTYNTGGLLPGDQSRIASWQQSQTQAVKDYYTKAGLADSSMAQEALGQVKQQADSMRSQANQNLIQPAMAASGLATQYANQLVQYQLMQDQQKQQAMQNFFGTVAQLGGMALFGT